ncbi:MAG: hypothetical protein KC731_15830, partial [Myxococcales bacterium]|nr:hypothetical protein [Myxococcales bacterium]
DNPLLDVQLPESDHNPGATGSRPPTQPEIRQPPPKTISRLPGLISKVAAARNRAERVNRTSAKKLRSWRARGCPFDVAYMPASPLLRRRGSPARPDPSDVAHVALLWPYSPFFMELSTASVDETALKKPRWIHGLDEVSMMILLSNAAERGVAHEVLTKLSHRVLTEGAKARDPEAMDLALQAWLRRERPLRTYKPRSKTPDGAAHGVYRYVREALLTSYKDALSQRPDLPRSTAKRWAQEGIVPAEHEVEAIRTQKERRMKHQGDYPSQAQVAKALGCSRSTVAKYTAEAERRAGLRAVKGEHAIGYPDALVEELRSLIARTSAPASTRRFVKRRNKRKR